MKKTTSSTQKIYQNETGDTYCYQTGQYESHKTENHEAVRSYQSLEKALAKGIPGKKNAEQLHRLESERALMQYPNELSQLTERISSDSWQG